MRTNCGARSTIDCSSNKFATKLGMKEFRNATARNCLLSRSKLQTPEKSTGRSSVPNKPANNLLERRSDSACVQAKNDHSGMTLPLPAVPSGNFILMGLVQLVGLLEYTGGFSSRLYTFCQSMSLNQGCYRIDSPSFSIPSRLFGSFCSNFTTRSLQSSERFFGILRMF